MQIALPQDAAHGIRRRALLVDVFNGRIELEDTAYADDDPPSVIRQRSALGIEEDKGFLGRDGTEESIKHCQLVPALLNPELIEFEVGLEFRSKIDLVSLGSVGDAVVRILHHPSERNSRGREGCVVKLA